MLIAYHIVPVLEFGLKKVQLKIFTCTMLLVRAHDREFIRKHYKNSKIQETL